MKKTISLLLCIILTISLSTIVYANSSWHWVTTSPKTILPFAIVVTLLIETLGISRFNSITNSRKVFIIICFANALSFIAPYLERAYRFIPTSGGYSISAAFNKGPYYIVLTGYLLLTLIIEIPIVYSLLKIHVQNKRRLIVTIIGANILTTLLVAICERIICVGQW